MLCHDRSNQIIRATFTLWLRNHLISCWAPYFWAIEASILSSPWQMIGAVMRSIGPEPRQGQAKWGLEQQGRGNKAWGWLLHRPRCLWTPWWITLFTQSQKYPCFQFDFLNLTLYFHHIINSVAFWFDSLVMLITSTADRGVSLHCEGEIKMKTSFFSLYIIFIHY